jgi:hypothetical protein
MAELDTVRHLLDFQSQAVFHRVSNTSPAQVLRSLRPHVTSVEDFQHVVNFLAKPSMDQDDDTSIPVVIRRILCNAFRGKRKSHQATILLRKLAASALPFNGRARHAFYSRHCLLNEDSASSASSGIWTKAQCIRILQAIVDHAPQHARIPTIFRTRPRLPARNGSGGTSTTLQTP